MAKPLGARVGDAVARPDTIAGKKVSLNLRSCKWFEPPSQDSRLHLDAHAPTVLVPRDADPGDLKCIMLKIKVGHLVLGDKPTPEVEKVPDVLRRHCKVIEENFDYEYTSKYVLKIFNGPTYDGGYRKHEIIDAMLQAELAKKNRARKQVVESLQEILEVLARMQGGTSSVRSEELTDKDVSLSGYVPPKATDADVERLLNE